MSLVCANRPSSFENAKGQLVTCAPCASLVGSSSSSHPSHASSRSRPRSADGSCVGRIGDDARRSGSAHFFIARHGMPTGTCRASTPLIKMAGGDDRLPAVATSSVRLSRRRSSLSNRADSIDHSGVSTPPCVASGPLLPAAATADPNDPSISSIHPIQRRHDKDIRR
jgi:hypothetical protein